MLAEGKTVLKNCPELSDVKTACDILSCLGCRVCRTDDLLEIDSSNLSGSEIPEGLMNQMRSSIVFMGALLSRNGVARVCFPGG